MKLLVLGVGQSFNSHVVLTRKVSGDNNSSELHSQA